MKRYAIIDLITVPGSRVVHCPLSAIPGSPSRRERVCESKLLFNVQRNVLAETGIELVKQVTPKGRIRRYQQQNLLLANVWS
jgi:hypothetical protein